MRIEVAPDHVLRLCGTGMRKLQKFWSKRLVCESPRRHVLLYFALSLSLSLDSLYLSLELSHSRPLLSSLGQSYVIIITDNASDFPSLSWLVSGQLQTEPLSSGAKFTAIIHRI